MIKYEIQTVHVKASSLSTVLTPSPLLSICYKQNSYNPILYHHLYSVVPFTHITVQWSPSAKVMTLTFIRGVFYCVWPGRKKVLTTQCGGKINLEIKCNVSFVQETTNDLSSYFINEWCDTLPLNPAWMK